MTVAQHAAAYLEKKLPIAPENQDLLSSTASSFLSRAKAAAEAAAQAASGTGGMGSDVEAEENEAVEEEDPSPPCEAQPPVLTRQTKLSFLLYLLHMEYRK
mmetsp:Transcript_19988/g.60710  ORF Transcript_19988/g.60710 Transcript_19988/m.60710 type:complete len:101 (+) Transcript_19988:2081-2383(+)|eukprot:scaffold296646_cov33-Tisochrysis_lutea.AAC.2